MYKPMANGLYKAPGQWPMAYINQWPMAYIKLLANGPMVFSRDWSSRSLAHTNGQWFTQSLQPTNLYELKVDQRF